MSLSDFLEKLQNKPRSVRIFILWSSVTISMVILFILWVWSMGANQGKEIKVASQSEVQEVQSFSEIKKEIPSLWQSLKASLGDLFNSGTKMTETQKKTSEGDKVPPVELPK